MLTEAENHARSLRATLAEFHVPGAANEAPERSAVPASPGQKAPAGGSVPAGTAGEKR
jgi:hypothetical protein